MLKRALFVTATMLMLSAVASDSFPQSSPSADWAIHTHNSYRVLPNITYMTATGCESKLDVYRRRDTTNAQPTLVFYHGGGPGAAGTPAPQDTGWIAPRSSGNSLSCCGT